MKYKVGDRVKIVSKRSTNFNILGKMDKYLGKTMTIKRVYDCYYEMKEDYEGWCWTDEDIECKVDFTDEDLKPGMFVELKNGKKGILIPI